MRLLLISTEFPPGPGGIGTHAWQLALQLGRLGWQVRVLTAQDYAIDAEILSWNRTQPFEVVRMVSRQGFWGNVRGRWREFDWALEPWAPDVVLASGERSVWLAAVRLRRKGLPLVAVGHGSEFRLNRNWQRWLTRWAYSRTSCVISVSHFTKGQMLGSGVKPRMDAVIPNGADHEAFGIGPDAIPALPSDPTIRHRLITVGNVTERKGQATIIRAMPAILVACPGTHYYMVGLPTLQSALEKVAGDLGVRDHIHFLGRIDHGTLLQHLRATDIFLMTSVMTSTGDCEGYGIAVVEAALCGKPAIVSNQSGLIEAIVDGETGLGVPEHDADATARAVISLLSDPARCRAMGDRARQRALSEQTWEARARVYDELLRGIVGARALAR